MENSRGETLLNDGSPRDRPTNARSQPAFQDPVPPATRIVGDTVLKHPFTRDIGIWDLARQEPPNIGGAREWCRGRLSEVHVASQRRQLAASRPRTPASISRYAYSAMADPFPRRVWRRRKSRDILRDMKGASSGRGR